MRYLKTVLALMLSVSFSATAEQPWSLQYKDKNIKLYERAIQGSEFKQTKAEVSFNAPLFKVQQQFSQQDGCWKWQSKCDSNEVLKQHDNTYYIYTVVDMPWPISDRDFVFKAVWQQLDNNKAMILTLTPEADLVPLGDYVRGQSNIQYSLTSVSEQETELEVIMHTEMGGDISASLVNGKLIDALHKDIKLLRKLVE